MNIPHHTVHAPGIRHLNKSFLDLLQLPISDLISKSTGNSPIKTLVLDKITLIRRLNLGIPNENIKLQNKFNSKYEKALNLRLKTLVSLLNPDQSCRFILKSNQDVSIINSIATKILNDPKSTPAHLLSLLTSIIYKNKINNSKFIGSKNKILQRLEDAVLVKTIEIINTNHELDIHDLTYFLLLFSVYAQFDVVLPGKLGEYSLISPNLPTKKPQNSVEISGNSNVTLVNSAIESISSRLLYCDICNPETISLLLESIANVYDIGQKHLINLNKLLQKLLQIPISSYLIQSDDCNKPDIKTPLSSQVLSRVLYGIYKTENFTSPIFSHITTLLKEYSLQDIKFTSPLDLFRTSFSLIVSNQLSDQNIFKWLLNETVRLSNEAIKFPSQFLFLLTGLSLSTRSVSDSEKTHGSSISFDKSIYERAEADLRHLETGELSFKSDFLSIKHLFSLAESLIPELQNSEFVQLLHSFCSTKLHHSRLVKIKLFSESMKRLPTISLDSLPQLLRSSIWLLGTKSDETARLAYSLIDRLMGELLNNNISNSHALVDSLILLDKCKVFSRQLATASSVALSLENYNQLAHLDFAKTINLLHYLSNTVELSIKTNNEIKEGELEKTRDFLFAKSIYTMKMALEERPIIPANSNSSWINSDINLDSLTSLLHSAHIKGEITRFGELMDLTLNLINKNSVKGVTTDSMNEYLKLLGAMSGKEYKCEVADGIYRITTN